MTFKSILKQIIIILLFLLIKSELYSGYFEEGCKYFTHKQYDLARDMFLKNIEITDNGNSYYFLGEIEKKEGNLDKAEEYYRLSITKNLTEKYQKLAYWNLIVIEKQKGKYNEMVILCRELWEKMKYEAAKKEVESLINRLLWTNSPEAKEHYNYGMEYKRKKMPEEARNAFYSALQIDPNFLAAKFEIGIAFYNEDNIDNAIHYLKAIIDEIPFYGEVHLLLGNIYFNKQLYRYSIEHFENAMKYGFLDNDTKYLIWLKRGTSYYEIGEYEKADADITIAMEVNKNAVEPLLLLSAIYIKSNNFEQALSILKRAKKLKQNNPEIIFQIGSLYFKTGDLNYVQYFDLLFDILYATKDPLPLKYFKAFILLIKDHYKQGKFNRVLKIVEVLPEHLKDYEIIIISARTYHYLAKFDKAIEYFEKVSLDNDNRYFLSISYAKNGMMDKAKDILLDLSYHEGYLERAKTDSAIQKIAYEIENEKLKIEEERKKAEEERRRVEEERIKAESERLKAEKEMNKLKSQSMDSVEVSQEAIANPIGEGNIDNKKDTNQGNHSNIEKSSGEQNDQNR